MIDDTVSALRAAGVGRGAVGPAGPRDGAGGRLPAAARRSREWLKDDAELDRRRRCASAIARGRARAVRARRKRRSAPKLHAPVRAQPDAADARPRTGASTWPRSTTCARASTCAATRRRTRSRSTSARRSSSSPTCSTASSRTSCKVVLTVQVRSAGGRAGGRGSAARSPTSSTSTPTTTRRSAAGAGDAEARRRADGAAVRARRREGRPQRSVPLRLGQEIQALPRQARLSARCTGLREPRRFIRTRRCPSATRRPRPKSLLPVPGVALGIAAARIKNWERDDVLRRRARRRHRVGRRVHAEPLLRRAGHRLPRAPRARRRRADARARRQRRQRQRRHRRARASPTREATCAAVAQLLGCAPQRGAAVLDRRDHGAAAGRRGSSPALPRGAGRRCAPTAGSPRRGDHDDRHGAQGRVAARRRRRRRRSRSPASPRAPA